MPAWTHHQPSWLWRHTCAVHLREFVSGRGCAEAAIDRSPPDLVSEKPLPKTDTTA
ncbi:hypothetical protein HQO90_13060 [Rhodococcus fascians]|nr:hypothetical protein [Rhodococcus fascians]